MGDPMLRAHLAQPARRLVETAAFRDVRSVARALNVPLVSDQPKTCHDHSVVKTKPAVNRSSSAVSEGIVKTSGWRSIKWRSLLHAFGLR
jgi:hypothetical protein